MEQNKVQLRKSNSQEDIERSRNYCRSVVFEDVFESSQETNVVNDENNIEVQDENSLITTTFGNNNNDSQSRKTYNRPTTPRKSYTPRKSNNCTPRKTNNNTPKKANTPRKTTTPKKKNTPRKSLSAFKALVSPDLEAYLASGDENVPVGSYQQFKKNTPKKLPQKEVITITSSSTSPDVSDQDGPLYSTRTKTHQRKIFSLPRYPPPIINISSTSSPSSSPSPPPPPPSKQLPISKSKTFGFSSDSDAGIRASVMPTIEPTNTVNPEPMEVEPPVVVVSSTHHHHLDDYSQSYHETKKTLEESDSESDKFKEFEESQSKNFDRIVALSASFSQNCSIPYSCATTVFSPSPLKNDSQIIKESTRNPFSQSVCDASPPLFFSMPAKLTTATTNLNDSDTENMGSAETLYPDIVVGQAPQSNKLNNNNATDNSDNNNIIQSMEYADDGEKTSPEIFFGLQDQTNSINNSQDKTTKQASMTDYFKVKKKLKKKTKKVKRLKRQVKKLEKQVHSYELAARHSEMLKNPFLKGFNHAEHFKNQEQRQAERLPAVSCPTGECRCFCPPDFLGCECFCFCTTQ